MTVGELKEFLKNILDSVGVAIPDCSDETNIGNKNDYCCRASAARLTRNAKWVEIFQE